MTSDAMTNDAKANEKLVIVSLPQKGFVIGHFSPKKYHSHMPRVSAIVLNYRTPQDAVRCVQALLDQTVTDLEILVTDNHSEDDSVGVVRNRLLEDPRVRLVEVARNIGFGKANNYAARYAEGEYLLFINPDNELEPRGLEMMIAKIDSDPSIGIIAPQLVHRDDTIRDSYRSFPTVFDLIIKRTFLRHIFRRRLRRYLQWDEDPSEVRAVDWVVGACFMIRRSLFDELGGFDPRFFLFFEDTDLCKRVHQKGKKVLYFPEVKAKDRKRRLSEGGILSLFLKPAGRAHIVSAMKFFIKWRFQE